MAVHIIIIFGIRAFVNCWGGRSALPSWSQSSSYTTLPICKGQRQSSVAKVCFKIVLEHVSEEEEEALIEITLACLSTGLLTYLEYGSSYRGVVVVVV